MNDIIVVFCLAENVAGHHEQNIEDMRSTSIQPRNKSLVVRLSDLSHGQTKNPELLSGTSRSSRRSLLRLAGIFIRWRLINQVSILPTGIPCIWPSQFRLSLKLGLRQ
jgi:hypothetical protein